MVRVLNINNQIRIKLTNNQRVNTKEWKFLVNTWNLFYAKNDCPIIIELGENIHINPIIKRAFNLFYVQHKKPLIVIASNTK